MKKTEETETPDLTEETKPKPKLVRCYGHFTDSDGRGHCSFCGGRPGSSAVRYPDDAPRN